MTESAEAVAADVNSKRSVTIEIVNVTTNYCLINPRVYFENGGDIQPTSTHSAPTKDRGLHFHQVRRQSHRQHWCADLRPFERTQNDHIETLAIMFSVPWDYNLYKNWFSVGIFKKGRNCDKDLYKEMYYEKNQQERGFVREEAIGSGINYVGNYLDIKATMSPMGNAIMKVEVWDKLFTPLGQQAH